jgi:3-hydroxyisobutyrate dehydrogenase-like beta-hydroxyacid dehydrogenase
MKPVVGIMAQGGMGAATAQRLTGKGVEVLTVTTGRSAASAERAAKAGMKPVSEDAFVQADFILSIVPPREAIPLAKRMAPFLMRTRKKPIYIDLNAISPDTAMMVEMIVAPSKCGFLDGGIIGIPPRESDGYSPVFYVSGPDGEKAKALEEYGLRISVLDLPVGAASALKMSYAGITKGLIAMGSSMILAAHRAGISEALHAELSASQPNLLAGLSRSIPDMFGKAYRWVAEMEEIASFAGKGSTEFDIYSAIAQLYDRLGKDFAGEQKDIAALRAFFPEAPAKQP